MTTKIRVDGKVYEVPDDLVIDAQRHGELFWYVTMRDIVGVPYEITREEDGDAKGHALEVREGTGSELRNEGVPDDHT